MGTSHALCLVRVGELSMDAVFRRGKQGQGQPSIEASRSNEAWEAAHGGFQRRSRKEEAVQGSFWKGSQLPRENIRSRHI